MAYKETLNLPKTTFPMKANLSQKEPETLKFWEDNNIYSLVAKKNWGKPSFVLHDGPPYANGDIHLGHTLNKVHKDIIVKYKTLRGYFSPFVPGWDCHGQPIEYEVEKKLELKKADLSAEEFRKMCKDYALLFVERQKEQFKRLGVRGDWDRPYLTLDFDYEATNVKVFGELYQKGMIYKGKKPIHWCYHCQTALAEAEIEYEDEESPSIYLKFQIKNNPSFLGGYPEPKSFLIWTTTPWTLPANVAVALHPDTHYALVRAGKEIYILAENLLTSVFTELGIKGSKVLKTFKGREFENLKVKHPLKDFDSRVVLADFVDLNQGTGCVHIAPGHGEEDYIVGLKYNLPAPMPVDDRGFFTDEAGQFGGVHILKANDLIIEYLQKEHLLLKTAQIKHSYPHCWRCKNPVIFRATEQWFISMEKGDLRSRSLQAVPSVQWIPAWSENRITGMLNERPDWCLSRQRSWGVPLPIFYCKNCHQELVTSESLEVVEELFRREGADSWFKRDVKEILPASIKCSSCGQGHFVKENDILDVWFESGISQAAVLKNHPELKWPADLYVEGSDQHRGWFQSSLLTSIGTDGKPPYNAVLTHGFLVDEEKRKMSKSLGNVIDPLQVIMSLGADILRLWTASADYTTDIAISEDILSQVSEAYRKIRNTFRYLLGNLYDFDVRKDKVSYDDLQEIDKWGLLKLNLLLKQVTQFYESYQFYKVYQAIYNFCVIDLSGFYLDVLKDRLYTSVPDSLERRSAQTVLFEILTSLVKIVSPIITFSAEEVWQHLPEEAKEEISVELCSWPEENEKYFDKVLDEKWKKFLLVREEVLKALELAREQKVIGNSLEAQVNIYAGSKWFSFLESFQEVLPTLFIVSQVALEDMANAPAEALKAGELEIKIAVQSALGEKCERCWNYRESVGENLEHKNLCSQCLDAIKDRV